MSVQSEIDRIITAVGNAYSKVSKKGGTVPASQTVANLATAIDSIPEGVGLELVANVADGATVTATLGSKTVTGVSSDGQVRLKIPQEGKWTVSATSGAQVSIPQEVSVPATVDIALMTMQELNDTSWATIKQVSDAGAGANFWSVGDCKEIVLNGTVGATTNAGAANFNNETVSVFIIGFDHNAAVEGEGRIHFQLGKKDGKPIALVDGMYGGYKYTAGYFIMNIEDSNTGGWADCQMRQTVLNSNSASATNPNANTLLAALPEDLRAVMKPCTKYSDNVGGEENAASAVTATSDWLFLLSEYEYFGERTYANSAEQNYQAQYAYYSAGNSKVMYMHKKPTVTANVWCRSVSVEYGQTFCYVTKSGTADWEDATADIGVSPGFCI